MNLQDMIRSVVIDGEKMTSENFPVRSESNTQTAEPITLEKYISHHYGYELRIIVLSNGVVWTKAEKQSVARAGNCNGIKGGVWKRKDAYFFKYTTVDKWLESINATPSTFRGMPKGIK